MILANFLNKIFKVGGFVLEDANGKKHSIGYSFNRKTFDSKTFKEKTSLSAFTLPPVVFSFELRIRNIEIKNGSITEVVDLFYRNIEKGNLGGVSHFIDKLFSFLVKTY